SGRKSVPGIVAVNWENGKNNYSVLTRGGSDNHRSSNNNYSGSNNKNSSYGHDQRNRGHQSNRSTNYGSQQGVDVFFRLSRLFSDLLKTICFINYALMIRQAYDITSSLQRGALQFWYQSQMVNTRTDADLSAAVQNVLQTLLPHIREEIREVFRTGSGSSNAGGNPPPVTIHTWLECFNKQKPHSFEKATAPVDAENWISHMEKIFDVMGCEDSFKTRLAVYKFKETSTEFMQRFLRLAGFLGAAAGTEEEQAKNFQWGLRRQRSDDRHQPTSQQSSHRSHGHHSDRHGFDRRGGSDNHRSSNNNY
nr:hypothetical protein [Tanacetum cinerariifolium]